MRRLSRRRAFAAAAIVAAAVAGVWLWLGRDEVTPVSTGEAVKRLRAGPDAGGRLGPGVRVPRTGVYEYATEGEESFNAFVSATHEYPSVSTISISPGGCGLLVRWEPLRQRRLENDVCPRRDGWQMRSFLDVHEFFGHREERRYACERGIAFRERGSWSFECSYRDTTDSYIAEVVGIETLTVAGRRVETIHVRSSDAISGHEQGEGETDTWYRRADGLPVRIVSTSMAVAPVPGGSGTYREHYELRLLSPAPRR